MVNNPSDQKYLSNLVDSVVFKDLLDLKLVENRATALSLLTFEIKYSKKELGSAFLNRYPQAKLGLITIDNYF